MDALLPIVICLHFYKETRELGVALLLIWMAWRLVVPLIKAHGASDRRGPALPHVALFLGLLLVNARPIALRDDMAGPSQFLLIALGLVIGTLLTDNGWKAVLGWLGFSTLPVAALFLWHGAGAGFPLSLQAIDQIYNVHMPGHGGISRFATLMMLLTLCAWYGLLLRPGLPVRVLGLLSVLSGYILCLGSGSRVAQVAVPLAIGMAWVGLRLKGRSRRLQRRLVLAALGIPLALALWWFQVGPEIGVNRLSDLRRMEAARCWFSLMFSGRNRLLFGVGYGSEKPNQFCYHIPDARGQLGSIGHAHNTLAQMGGQHGILGILALLIVVVLVLMGLRRQLVAVPLRLPLGLKGTTWAEASLGLNVALAFNALATTVYIGNQVNQVLVGLLAATALRASSSVWLGAAPHGFLSPLVPEGSPPAPGGAAP